MARVIQMNSPEKNKSEKGTFLAFYVHKNKCILKTSLQVFQSLMIWVRGQKYNTFEEIYKKNSKTMRMKSILVRMIKDCWDLIVKLKAFLLSSEDFSDVFFFFLFFFSSPEFIGITVKHIYIHKISLKLNFKTTVLIQLILMDLAPRN